jgi:hypothetical protein
MKKVCFFLLAICLIGAACKEKEEKEKKEQTVEPQEPCYCIMDTLKGEWSWFKSSFGGYVYGETDNEYTSIIKILSSNKDGSMNYEVIVADTLFYKNSFRIQQGEHQWEWGYRRVNIKLPHYFNYHEYWSFCFGGPPENPDKDIMVFSWPGSMGGGIYYQKIK